MKTKREMIDEILASGADFITYGDGDLGMPIATENAIDDISGMNDEMIGEGTWYPCDEKGNVI